MNGSIWLWAKREAYNTCAVKFMCNRIQVIKISAASDYKLAYISLFSNNMCVLLSFFQFWEIRCKIGTLSKIDKLSCRRETVRQLLKCKNSSENNLCHCQVCMNNRSSCLFTNLSTTAISCLLCLLITSVVKTWYMITIIDVAKICSSVAYPLLSATGL